MRATPVSNASSNSIIKYAPLPIKPAKWLVGSVAFGEEAAAVVFVHATVASLAFHG